MAANTTYRCGMCEHKWLAATLTKCPSCGSDETERVVPRKRLPSGAIDEDPGANKKRAKWAKAALDAFRYETRVDREDLLSDLLCDIAHWCDRNKVDFQAELRRAARAYDTETRGVGTQFAEMPSEVDPLPRCTICGESIAPDESSVEDDGGEAHARCAEDAEDADAE